MKKKIFNNGIVIAALIVLSFLWYREKTKLIPEYAKVLYEMGLDCQQECEEDKQLWYFQKAAEYSLKSDDSRYRLELSDAHYRSALIYENQERFDSVIVPYLKAIDLNPVNVQAYYRIGLHYFKQGLYEYAHAYFTKAYKIGVFPEELYYYLARTYDEIQSYRFAIDFYHKIVSVRPEYIPEVFPRIAELYYILGDDKAYNIKLLRFKELKRYHLAEELERQYNAVKAANLSD